MDFEARLRDVITEAENVQATKSPPTRGLVGSPDVNPGKYIAWRTHAQHVLHAIEAGEGIYTKSFLEATEHGSYSWAVDAGTELLVRVLNDARAGHLNQAVVPPEALTTLVSLCERFHDVARQLRKRHDNRATLDVNDEYDVQDLLHALLLLHFQDVRAEDPTPTHAGASSRIDFVLKSEKIVVEVKKTRQGLDARKLGEELIIDAKRYQAHPDCETLMCFVYDPEGRIANPRGVENDLNQETPLRVRVLIRPA